MYNVPFRIIAAAVLAIYALLQPTGNAFGDSRQIMWQRLLPATAVRQPRAIAIDPRGSATANKWAYTTDSVHQRVVKFGTGGKVLAAWQYGDLTRRGNAASIAIGISGDIFVANPADNRVSKFSPNGRLLARWSGFAGLRAIVVDQSGHIYLAENQTHWITELSPSGSVLQRWDTRTLWNGGSAGNPTGLAPGPSGTIYVSTRCAVGFTGTTCAPRVSYLAGERSLHGGSDLIDLLLPLRAGGLSGDQRGLVGLARGSGKIAPRDPCNNRFVTLQSITSDPRHRLYVAGLLWPRVDDAPGLGVALGPGEPGCTHDGIGPTWKHWSFAPANPTPIHGLAVDAQQHIYVSEGDRIWKSEARSYTPLLETRQVGGR
jgi:hypothetical protein